MKDWNKSLPIKAESVHDAKYFSIDRTDIFTLGNKAFSSSTVLGRAVVGLSQ